MCVYALIHTCSRTHVKVNGQLSGVSFHLPLCSRRSQLSHVSPILCLTGTEITDTCECPLPFLCVPAVIKIRVIGLPCKHYYYGISAAPNVLFLMKCFILFCNVTVLNAIIKKKITKLGLFCKRFIKFQL